jgi:hypothetical protein
MLFLPTKILPTQTGHIIFIDQHLNELFKAHNSPAQGQAAAAGPPVCSPAGNSWKGQNVSPNLLGFFFFLFFFLFFFSLS